MEFIIRDVEGSEHGPVDQETLKKWVEDDRVNAKTEVRNALLRTWKTADTLDFLSELLEEQRKRELAVEDNFNKASKAAGKIGKLFQKKKINKKTAFVCKYLPEPAPLERRFLASLFDFTLIAIVAIGFFSYSIGVARKIAVRQTGSEELRAEDIIAEQDPDWVEGKEVEENSNVKDGKIVNKDGGKAKSPPKAAPNSDGEDSEAIDGETENGEADAEMPQEGEIVVESGIPDVIPDNLNAISPPSIFADTVNGYYLGSVWQDNAAGNERYVCLDAGEGAAKWIKLSKLRRIVTNTFYLLLVIVFLYYGITLGFFAQTFGMWYWGIFIVKRDTSEVYFLRAMVWTVMMLIMGLISPLCIYLFRWAPHDIIAKVRVIQVAGTPPAG